MECHLYLIAYRVEALVASMLGPEEFGTYMAVGTRKLSRGRLLFFEIDPTFKSDQFDLGLVEKHCVPHPDGTPKHSVYLSIYRVLEHLPLSVIRDLYCVTRDGRVLTLTAKPYERDEQQGPRLYQELCPVSPLIASTLQPMEFCRFVTDRTRPVSVPRLFFADLTAPPLDVAQADERITLPYTQLEHIRGCLQEVAGNQAKPTKTVDRDHSQEFFYRTIKDGFFLGDGKGVQRYPFPTLRELETTYYTWWRSATLE